MIEIKFQNLGKGIVPKYMTPGAVGADLYAAETVTIFSQDIVSIKTDIALEIPEGFEGQVRPRSSLFKKMGLLSPVGTIDQDFRGNIEVVIMNVNQQRLVVIKEGERIAQLVIVPVCKVVFKEDKLSSTDRGAGGFGSTGK